jgi:hypothetical protein
MPEQRTGLFLRLGIGRGCFRLVALVLKNCMANGNAFVADVRAG